MPLEFLATQIRYDGVLPFADLPIADLDRKWEWDADKANAVLGDPESPDWERFRKAHLWVDTDTLTERGEPTRDDFKFPIAEMIDGELTTVWSALAAVRSRLTSADIPADDREGIASHVDRYVEKINAALPEGEDPKALSTDSKPERSDGQGWVQRYDRGEIMPSPVLRADGVLLLSGVAAKPGVLKYLNSDGSTTLELVLPEELHRADSLESLARAPVTLEHPDQEVTPNNVAKFGVGDVDGDVTIVRANGFVTIKLAARRADAIKAINGGKQELSPGYRVRIDATPGVHPDFGPYDAIQRDREYNHLAIVDSARGGASVRLRTDGAAYQLVTDSPETQMNEKLLADLLAALGVTRSGSVDADLSRAIASVEEMLQTKAAAVSDIATVQEAAEAAAEQATSDADALKLETDTAAEAASTVATAAADQATEDLTKMTEDRDGLQAKVDAMTPKITAFETAEKARVDAAERKGLDETREKFKLDSVKDEDNTTLRTRLAEHAVTKVLGLEALRADASDVYCDAMIESGLAGMAKRWDSSKVYDRLGKDASKKPDADNRADGDDEPYNSNDSYQKRADAALAATRGDK